MISTIITALVSFFSTNIDDIFILMLFFSQVNKDIKVKHIVIGQYLGIGALTAISIAGALGISIIPQEYVGLLGIVPIYLGIKEYIEYKKEIKNNVEEEVQDTEENIQEQVVLNQENKTLVFIRKFISPSILKVAGVTIANGGDNIGIYIPVFSSMKLYSILIPVIVFLLLTGIWCFIGFKLAEHPFVNKNIERYKHIFVPIIFIVLGVLIILEGGTLSLFIK
ncbi:cadmium resistance transporter [Clostridium intestinale]|uniref:Cadmium resistance transporter (Or sequestration) family protein n=1 Tax=Clostridium intestinale DSM 6191 TaxID=1121320 RepID=A0A1M6CUQ3_9CLOT|nr:cadmium resistance transporter [Clostridium intestinale]SHI64571.1 cadmium resistance transporter (or sequestration) family protein [Clostridium intestinale DSM 6191]